MAGMNIMTPGEVAEHLQVSAPTVRRMAGAYELVFEPLQRDSRGHRAWSLDAVRRVQVAHAALSTGKVTSLEAALQMVRDGLDLPVPTVLSVEQDVLVELLTEVRELRALAEAQGRELVALRFAVIENRVLPASAPVSDELAREVVTAHPERVTERVKPERPTGFVGLLLRVIGVRL